MTDDNIVRLDFNTGKVEPKGVISDLIDTVGFEIDNCNADIQGDLVDVFRAVKAGYTLDSEQVDILNANRLLIEEILLCNPI